MSCEVFVGFMALMILIGWGQEKCNEITARRWMKGYNPSGDNSTQDIANK